MIENTIKELFKQLKLGKVRKIIKSDLRWANGDRYYVTTLFKKFIVYELDGEVKTIKDLNKVYYRK